MRNELNPGRIWIQHNEGDKKSFEKINEELANLSAPTLVTSIEVMGMRKMVDDKAPKVRIALGTLPPQSQLQEEMFAITNKDRTLKKLIVPYNSHLYWNDAVSSPLSLTFNKNTFYSWQNFGAELLDQPAFGIKPLVRMLPFDFETITRFSVFVGNEIAQDRLKFWAQLLGMDLNAAQRILKEHK